jgi:23S rRNA (pseudouridine1915-N3)-methyltransferase
MDIAIVAVGRLKAGPESELCARYLERAKLGGRGLGLRDFHVVEIAEARGARAAERIAGEEATILGHLGKGGRTVCLDEGGDLLDSAAFAARLARDAAASVPRTTFVIGGPDGIGQGVLASAEARISLGRMTWPHQIVRILLAEQLYRATTILSGHPYHRV